MKKTSTILFSFGPAVLFLFLYFFAFEPMPSPAANTVKPRAAPAAPCIASDIKECPPAGMFATQGSYTQDWQNLKIAMGKLPADSWFKMVTLTDTDYEMIVYPNMGKQEFSNPHDFYIDIIIKKSSRAPSPQICTQALGYDDLRDETFKNANFDITLMHRLNYSFQGPAGSNPNPYDYDIKQKLLDIFKSMRIGTCP